MRALFDTNILLDIGLARKPFAAAAIACFTETVQTGEPPRIAPHALATFYYIVAQARDRSQADTSVSDLLATVEVVGFDHEMALRSVALSFKDFEDAMIAVAAEAAAMDCIVTRNVRDFDASSVPALSPEAFLRKLRGLI
ncbi:MAG: PIN domain-containing protein [Opitutales bacterium]